MTTTCSWEGCALPGAARTAALDTDGVGVRPGLGLMIVRPAGSPVKSGVLLCVEHAHHQLDLMLLRALPKPGQPQ